MPVTSGIVNILSTNTREKDSLNRKNVIKKLWNYTQHQTKCRAVSVERSNFTMDLEALQSGSLEFRVYNIRKQNKNHQLQKDISYKEIETFSIDSQGVF